MTCTKCSDEKPDANIGDPCQQECCYGYYAPEVTERQDAYSRIVFGLAKA